MLTIRGKKPVQPATTAEVYREVCKQLSYAAGRFAGRQQTRRDARVAEGAPLLREYGLYLDRKSVV